MKALKKNEERNMAKNHRKNATTTTVANNHFKLLNIKCHNCANHHVQWNKKLRSTKASFTFGLKIIGKVFFFCAACSTKLREFLQKRLGVYWIQIYLARFQEPCLVSKKIATHPDIAHPFANPPATPTMKGIPTYSLLGKVAKGVCSSSVCWNNLR